MSAEPEVALVLSADEWVDALHRHCADHGGARVRCLVLDLPRSYRIPAKRIEEYNRISTLSLSYA